MGKSDIHRFKIIAWWLLVAFIAGGCNPTKIATTRNSSTNTLESTIQPTDTLTPQPTLTRPPFPTRTPTPIPVAECPEVNNQELIETPKDYPEFEVLLVKYLNDGGNPETLSEVLSNKPYLLDPNIVLVNLNNDLSDEIIFMGHVIGSESPDPVGGIIALSCVNGEYVSNRVYWGYYFYHPSVFAVIDINNDIQKEIVITFVIGQSFCESGIAIVGLNKQFKVIDYFSKIKNTPDCPSTLNFIDLDEDGIMEVVAAGRTTSSMGGGVSRGQRNSYKLSDFGKYELSSIELLPSNYRIHVIEDAQIALDDGNLELALEHYQLGAYSDDLEDVIPWSMVALVNSDPDYETHAYEYLTAIAFFRMIAIHLSMDDLNEVDEILLEMEKRYPEGSAGNEFIEFAEIIIKAFERGKSPIEACTSVTNYILNNYPNLEYDIGHWGLANISFHNETICPFLPE